MHATITGSTCTCTMYPTSQASQSPTYRLTPLAKVLIPPDVSIRKARVCTKTSARVLTSYENMKALEDKELKREMEGNKRRQAEERACRKEEANSHKYHVCCT